MIRLSEVLDSVRTVLLDHPNCYLLLSVSTAEVSYNGVFRVHSVFDNKEQIISLGEYPIAYSPVNNKLLAKEEIASLMSGSEILVPIAVLEVNEDNLLYRISNDRFVYKLSKGSWNQIILHFI